MGSILYTLFILQFQQLCKMDNKQEPREWLIKQDPEEIDFKQFIIDKVEQFVKSEDKFDKIKTEKYLQELLNDPDGRCQIDVGHKSDGGNIYTTIYVYLYRRYHLLGVLSFDKDDIGSVKGTIV